MMLHVITIGALTTIQTPPDYRWLHNGVLAGGPADADAFRKANQLVSNPHGAAVLETAGAGFSAIAVSDCWLGFTGAGGRWYLGRTEVENNRSYFVPKGMMIKNTGSSQGNYACLSVAGGFVTHRKTVQPGDILAADQHAEHLNFPLKKLENGLKTGRQFVLPLTQIWEDNKLVIRAFPGQETHWWAPQQVDDFFNMPWIVSRQSNRMGIRLTGNALPYGNGREMLTTGVAPGTVQVPPDGLPIVLMADAQTTGGYPRIAQVAEADLSRLAQLPPGAVFHFKKITGVQAEAALQDQHF